MLDAHRHITCQKSSSNFSLYLCLYWRSTQLIFPPNVLISQLPTLEPHHLFAPCLMFTMELGPPKILWVFTVSANHRRMSQPVSISNTQVFLLKTFCLTSHLHMAHPLKCHSFKLTQIFVHTQFILIVQLARVLLFTRVLHFNPKHKLLALLPPTHCCPPSDSIHNLPSSSLQVTISDAHHIRYTPPDAHCQVSISWYFLDIQPQQISSPTQVGANRCSSFHVRPRDESSDNRHPTMQPSEAKRRRTAGKDNL